MKYGYMIVSFFILFLPTTCLATDYTGMWWDASKPGTGIFIEQLPGSNCVCGAWYLYDQQGKPLWTTFWGNISDDQQSSQHQLKTQLYSFTGPKFGNMWDSSMVKAKVAGQLTLTFKNSTNIDMAYEVQGVTGQMHLTMFSNGLCPGWLWWDPEKPGQGVALFHYLDNEGLDRVGLAWYLYDDQGSPMWFTGTEQPEGEGFELWRFSGPVLGVDWDGSDLLKSSAGTVRLENVQPPEFSGGDLISPTNNMTYSVGGISGSLALQYFMYDCNK